MNPEIAQRILDAGNAIDDEQCRFWYNDIAETLISNATETPDDVETFIHHIREDAIRNDSIERFVKAMRGQACDYIAFDEARKGFVCMLVDSQTEVLVQLTAI